MKMLLPFLLLPVLAVATEIPEKDWEYERIDGDHAIIYNTDQSRRPSAIDQTTAGDVVVPSTLRSMQVVSIGEKAFYECSKLTSVTIPEGVTNIAANAFYGCSSLTNVVIPTSMKSIGTDAFRSCTKLQMVVLTCSSLAMGGQAFTGCSSLEDFSFTGDYLTLGASVFSSCYELCNFAVSTKSLTIGSSVFAGCTALTNAVLAGTVSATIGESAFSGCTALQTIDLPIALKDVATNAFYNCKNLELVSLSTNVTHISYRAFDSCAALKSVDIVEGLSSIDAQAFYGCSSITNLTFPQSLSSIGARAFEKCEGLTCVAFAEGNATIASSESVMIGERAFYQCSAITNVALPQKLTSMGARAFSQCDSLVNIALPTNFTDIASSLFEDCSALPTVNLPLALKTVGDSAFFNCTNLTNFIIPTNNAVTIGSKAFNNTKYWNDYPDDLVVNNGYILGFKGNPTSVTLPDGCKAISVGMFEGMTTLKSVVIPDSVTEIGARAFNGCISLTNIAFNSVTTIGNSAFEGCTSLSGVKLSESLGAIPGSCFKGCAALLSIDIPAEVVVIGEYAFYNCAVLTAVTGAEGVNTVGDYAFAQCPLLQAFAFPNDVSYGDHVFQGCNWTDNVLFPRIGTLKDEYPSTYAQIKSIVFSSNLSVITNSACAGCASLTHVRIPDGVTSIGTLAFEGCTALTSVVMSASVTAIQSDSFKDCSAIAALVVSGRFAVSKAFPGVYAKLTEIGIADDATSLCTNLFANCSALTSVDIPWRVTEIGARAFYGCTGLKEIVVTEYVTSIGAMAFGGCTGLKSVGYLCEKPDDGSVSDDVYSGTRTDLKSKVLPWYSSWQTAESGAGVSVLPSEWKSRPIVWWASVQKRLAKVKFSNYDGAGSGTSMYFLANSGRQLLTLPEPEREGYTFIGWFTAPYGGVQILEGTDVTGSVTYYAHWSKDDEADPSVEYDFSRANTFNGYLTEGGDVAGSVQIKFSRGRWDRSEEETNAVATATVQLLGEGRLTVKGTLHESGSGELTHSRTERTMDISMDDANTLTGSFDGYDVVAYRNLFSSSSYDDRSHANAMLDDVKGNYVVVLSASGGSAFTTGYAALSVAIGSRGQVKVSGAMPDGAKVSVSAQLAIAKAYEFVDDTGCIPVVVPLYSGKGGLGFLLSFDASGDDGIRSVELSGVSNWIADKNGTAVALSEVGVQPVAGLDEGDYAFSANISSLASEDVSVDETLSPDGTLFSATAKKWTLPRADSVKFVRDEGYVVTTDNGNPAALKLVYKSGTGLFKGSFKVYGVTADGRSRKYTATVNGGVVGGEGFGAAVIKKVGSTPVVVQ